MKTSFYFRTLIYEILQNSPISAIITGNIYNGNRPANSSKEDITLHYLSGINRPFQEATLLIHIYFADIESIDGSYPIEDTERGGFLAALACNILDGIETGAYMTYIEDQTSFAVEDATTPQHCIQIKLTVTQANI